MVEEEVTTEEAPVAEEEKKIVDGEVGDTFKSNRGTEVIVKKTKNNIITQSKTEMIDPANQKDFGLKNVTKIYEQIYGDKMNETNSVPKLNVYSNTCRS